MNPSRATFSDTSLESRDAEIAGRHLMPSQYPRTLLEYCQLLWEKRRFLTKTAICALILTAVIALLLPMRYQSTTELMPPDQMSGSGMALLAGLTGGLSSTSLGAQIAGDFLGSKTSGALWVGMLQSEAVQDALIGKFNLMKVYHDTKIEDARKDLAKRSDIAEDRKSGIISIAVTDRSPERAAEMAQAYVQQLDRLVSQVSTSSARRERIFLEQRLKKVKSDLDAAANRFSDFASKNTAIDIPAQGKAMVEAAAALQGQLIAAQAELKGLSQIYTDNNVRVREAEARVKELQDQLQRIGGAGSEEEVSNDNSLYPSIRKLPLLGVKWADLYRETKIQETVYELLTRQYELAKVQEAKEIPTVKVLAPALVPTKKSFPPRTLIVVLGVVFAELFAILYLIASQAWRVIDPRDPRKMFAHEVFCTVQESARRRLPTDRYASVQRKFSFLVRGRGGRYKESVPDAKQAED